MFIWNLYVNMMNKQHAIHYVYDMHNRSYGERKFLFTQSIWHVEVLTWNRSGLKWMLQQVASQQLSNIFSNLYCLQPSHFLLPEMFAVQSLGQIWQHMSGKGEDNWQPPPPLDCYVVFCISPGGHANRARRRTYSTVEQLASESDEAKSFYYHTSYLTRCRVPIGKPVAERHTVALFMALFVFYCGCKDELRV